MLNIQPGTKCKMMKPLLRQTNAGKSICTFTLYTSSKKNGTDEWESEFFDGIAFNDVAERIATTPEKSFIELKQAAVKQESWTDKEGKKKSKLRILVFDFTAAGTKEITADDMPL